MIDRKFIFDLVFRWAEEKRIILGDESINDLTDKICRLFDIEGDNNEQT